MEKKITWNGFSAGAFANVLFYPLGTIKYHHLPLGQQNIVVYVYLYNDSRKYCLRLIQMMMLKSVKNTAYFIFPKYIQVSENCELMTKTRIFYACCNYFFNVNVH
jgi:hypothetical protein